MTELDFLKKHLESQNRSFLPQIKKIWPLWIGFNGLKTAESLQEDNLILTFKFLEVSGTSLINMRMVKCHVNPGATQWL